MYKLYVKCKDNQVAASGIPMALTLTSLLVKQDDRNVEQKLNLKRLLLLITSCLCFYNV